MLVTDIETFGDHLAELEAKGQVAFDGVAVTLEKRAGARVVIGFAEVGQGMSWLAETCEAEGLTEILVTASAKDLTGDRVAVFLKELAASALVRAVPSISLCGAGAGSIPVLAFAHLFKEPVLVAFDPPQDVAARPAPEAAAAYVVYDPLLSPRPAAARVLDGPGVHWLKCFATNGSSIEAIARMKILHAVLPAALRGELLPLFFYSQIRCRKDFRFYRIAVEAALEARGKARRVPAFRDLFRKRRHEQSDAGRFSNLRDYAEANRPDRPGAWARLGQGDAPPTWPSAGGNVWMLEQRDDALLYMSDRWHGVTMGFEERDGITLAQTPRAALGFVGFGDGMQVERSLLRRFPWHVTDFRLDGSMPAFGPMSEAALVSADAHAAHGCLYSILAISQPQSGITAAEALPGSVSYEALLEQVRSGRKALERWNKSLSLDRLRLALLTGAPATSEVGAADHYATVAMSLCRDLAAITGQQRPPFVVVVPHAGTRYDGASEVSLAEARFDQDNIALNAVVPTPAYPWPLMAGTPGSHSPIAALLIDELSALAIRERQQGRLWHCPALQLARVSGRRVTAQFSSMDGLELGEGAHGFHLIGSGDVPGIKRAEVISDREVQLELEAEASTDGFSLAYAWGHRIAAEHTDQSANHGTLRDRWQQASRAVPGQILHRFALPGRVPLLRVE